jgi:hypothetical protein
MTDAEREITAAVRAIAARRPTSDRVGDRGSRGEAVRTRNAGTSGHGRNSVGQVPMVGRLHWIARCWAAISKRGRGIATPLRALKAATAVAAVIFCFSVISHRQSIPDRPTWTKLVYQVWW